MGTRPAVAATAPPHEELRGHRRSSKRTRLRGNAQTHPIVTRIPLLDHQPPSTRPRDRHDHPPLRTALRRPSTARTRPLKRQRMAIGHSARFREIFSQRALMTKVGGSVRTAATYQRGGGRPLPLAERMILLRERLVRLGLLGKADAITSGPIPTLDEMAVDRPRPRRSWRTTARLGAGPSRSSALVADHGRPASTLAPASVAPPRRLARPTRAIPRVGLETQGLAMLEEQRRSESG